MSRGQDRHRAAGGPCPDITQGRKNASASFLEARLYRSGDVDTVYAPRSADSTDT